jgi:hypothetical protein
MFFISVWMGGHKMGFRFRDFAIMMPSKNVNVPDEGDPDAPVKDGFDLSDDMWIGQLDINLAKRILDACEPRGENFSPTRECPHLYAFVRENIYDELPQPSWDSDKKLQQCIALSRIVRPTSIGFQYAACLRENGIMSIIPADTAFGR